MQIEKEHIIPQKGNFTTSQMGTITASKVAFSSPSYQLIVICLLLSKTIKAHLSRLFTILYNFFALISALCLQDRKGKNELTKLGCVCTFPCRNLPVLFQTPTDPVIAR